MELGRVTGTVVATTIYVGLEGVRLLIVQPASREASLALPSPPGPVDHAIVGIVDAVEEWSR
jgi:microcompartment protein CcmK/EutM